MTLPKLRPDTGPILRYLSQLPDRDRAEAMEAVNAAFSTPAGTIVMDLLEKAIQDRSVPIDGNMRALEYLNAQRFIVSDFQQILRPANEYVPSAAPASKRSRQ